MNNIKPNLDIYNNMLFIYAFNKNVEKLAEIMDLMHKDKIIPDRQSFIHIMMFYIKMDDYQNAF